MYVQICNVRVSTCVTERRTYREAERRTYREAERRTYREAERRQRESELARYIHARTSACTHTHTHLGGRCQVAGIETVYYMGRRILH